MKKISRRNFLKAAGMTAAAGALAACGSSSSSTASSAASSSAAAENAESSSTVYRVLYSSEITTLNYLTTSNSGEMGVGANVIDTLVEYDSDANIQPGLASEWSYDEATLTWTFTLREGCSWVDNTGAVVADVTAQDFVDAMKYVLTPSYESSTVSNLFGVIANAEEYYNGLAGEEGYAEIDFSEVGVKAVDAHTLTYTLAKEIPYFVSMLTYVDFMPAYGPQLEELGTSFATSADTMYYCGAYYISSYEPQVEMVYTRNETNWDADNVFITEIHKTYNAEASTIGPEMAKRGEVDYTTLSADVVDAWLSDPETSDMVSMERPSLDYSYFYCFNFNIRALNEDFYRDDAVTGFSVDEQYEPENWELAVNNEAFRQSIRYALSRAATMSQQTGSSIDPDTYLLNTITPTGFCKNDEGVDYTQQGALADLYDTDPYDTAKAVEYKEQAMSELDGKVTFPVKVLVRYNPSTSNWENQCTVLEQQLESVLGSDYIDIIVEAGPSENFLSQIRRSCNYMLLLCNWGADYADPETYTDPFYQSANDDGSYNRGMRYAYMAYSITDGLESADTVKGYFDLVDAAKAITDDTDARYEAFAEAEAYLINHALAVPYSYSVPDFVASKLNPFEGQYAAFGVSKLRYKGQHLYDDFFSMEEYEANAAK